VQFSEGDALVFGRETTGIPTKIQESIGLDSIIKIPIYCNGVRSLNLSNAVSIVLYEGLRQIGFS